MTILSSRAHTCIHPQVSRMANKDDLCKKLNKEKFIGGESAAAAAAGGMISHDDDGDDRNKSSGGCSFLQRLKKQPPSYENFGFKQPVWDIEELVTALKKKRVRQN